MFTFWLSASFLGLKTRGLRLEPGRVWEGDLVVIRLNRPKKKKKEENFIFVLHRSPSLRKT